MKSQNKLSATLTKAVKAVAEKTLTADANSTTCILLHQPKAPESLKKFSKIK